MQSPPTKAKKWHPWADKGTLGNDGKTPNNTTFFDAKTRSLLDQALAERLDRFTGWDLSNINAQNSYIKAASCFKRGVPVKYNDQEEPCTHLNGSYPIEIISPEIAPAEALKHAFDKQQLFIVMDKSILDHWDLSPIKAHYLMEANEKNKNIDTVEAICKTAKGVGNPMHWLIIGGGITADTAAFAAHLMQKTFTLVPTTLLSMADACVGGKTGVNAAPFGKNLIGAFAFPSKVMVIPQFLTSLSTRVLRSGGAECLKHAFLAGEPKKAQKISQALKQEDLASLSEELKFIIELKAKVVAEDPTEKGKRAILNLGHTLAHALEAISHKNRSPDDHIQHGEAVAVGLSFCFLMSKQQIPESKPSMDEMISCLVKSGLLPPRNQLEKHLGFSLEDDKLWPEIKSFILNDKKMSDNNQESSNWILLKSWGKIHSDQPEGFLVPLTMQEVHQAWLTFLDEYTL